MIWKNASLCNTTYILQLRYRKLLAFWTTGQRWGLKVKFLKLNSTSHPTEGLKSSTTNYDKTSRLTKSSCNKKDVNLYQLKKKKTISDLKNYMSNLFFQDPIVHSSIYYCWWKKSPVFQLVVYEPSFNQVFFSASHSIFTASHSIAPVWSCLVQVLNPGRFKTVPPRFASLPLSLSLVVAVHHRVDEWHPSAAAWLPPVPRGSLEFETWRALQRLEKVDIAICNIVTKEKQANWLVKYILVSLVMGIKLELLRNHAISAVGLIFFWVCMHPGNTSEHDSHSKLTYHMYIRHSWSQLCLYFSYFISSTKRPGVIALKQPKQP